MVRDEPYFKANGVEIYHGDSRLLLPRLMTSGFDVLLTDPPYGISFAAQPTKWQRKDGKQAEEWDNSKVDSWLLEMARAAADVQIVWGGNYYSLPPSRGWLCWTKPDSPPSMGDAEFAWTNQDSNARHLDHSISATNQERCGHPTQKPLKVMKWCLEPFDDAETLVDPFAGSGTSLLAAKEIGMQAVGIEKEEEHCEMAAERLRQAELFTGARTP